MWNATYPLSNRWTWKLISVLGYFSTWLQSTIREAKAGTQSRNAETSKEPCLHCFLSLLRVLFVCFCLCFYFCYFLQLRLTCPEVTPPTIGWILPYQSAIKKRLFIYDFRPILWRQFLNKDFFFLGTHKFASSWQKLSWHLPWVCFYCSDKIPWQKVNCGGKGIFGLHFSFAVDHWTQDKISNKVGSWSLVPTKQGFLLVSDFLIWSPALASLIMDYNHELK